MVATTFRAAYLYDRGLRQRLGVGTVTADQKRNPASSHLLAAGFSLFKVVIREELAFRRHGELGRFPSGLKRLA